MYFVAGKLLEPSEGTLTLSEEGKLPPMWIRRLLIFTCTGAGFSQGSNDGQKGMGVIML